MLLNFNDRYIFWPAVKSAAGDQKKTLDVLDMISCLTFDYRYIDASSMMKLCFDLF